MGEINIGAIGGSVTGSAIGRHATVHNTASPMPLTSVAEFLAQIAAIRRTLQQEAMQGPPDLAREDAIAALAWLYEHHGDPTKPADADQRFSALKRLQKVWTLLVDMVKQVPAGVIATWIVEGLK